LTIQVSKTDACRGSGLGIQDWSSILRETAPRAQHATVPLLTTHCLHLAKQLAPLHQTLCSEKNYRLQDIQLSKNPRSTSSRFREFARRAASLAKLCSFSSRPDDSPSVAHVAGSSRSAFAALQLRRDNPRLH